METGVHIEWTNEEIIRLQVLRNANFIITFRFR